MQSHRSLCQSILLVNSIIIRAIANDEVIYLLTRTQAALSSHIAKLKLHDAQRSTDKCGLCQSILLVNSIIIRAIANDVTLLPNFVQQAALSSHTAKLKLRDAQQCNHIAVCANQYFLSTVLLYEQLLTTK